MDVIGRVVACVGLENIPAPFSATHWFSGIILDTFNQGGGVVIRCLFLNGFLSSRLPVGEASTLLFSVHDDPAPLLLAGKHLLGLIGSVKAKGLSLLLGFRHALDLPSTTRHPLSLFYTSFQP